MFSSWKLLVRLACPIFFLISDCLTRLAHSNGWCPLRWHWKFEFTPLLQTRSYCTLALSHPLFIHNLQVTKMALEKTAIWLSWLSKHAVYRWSSGLSSKHSGAPLCQHCQIYDQLTNMCYTHEHWFHASLKLGGLSDVAMDNPISSVNVKVSLTTLPVVLPELSMDHPWMVTFTTQSDHRWTIHGWPPCLSHHPLLCLSIHGCQSYCAIYAMMIPCLAHALCEAKCIAVGAGSAGMC